MHRAIIVQSRHDLLAGVQSGLDLPRGIEQHRNHSHISAGQPEGEVRAAISILGHTSGLFSLQGTGRSDMDGLSRSQAERRGALLTQANLGSINTGSFVCFRTPPIARHENDHCHERVSTLVILPALSDRCGSFSLNKTLKLFVAGYDGVVCVYEVNTIDGGECKQISQYLLFSMSPNSNQATAGSPIGESFPNVVHCRRSLLDGSARPYPTNLISNDNASVPLSSTPPPSTPKSLAHPSTTLAIDEQNFPRLPSPPQGVYD